jgi:Sulfotransferase family
VRWPNTFLVGAPKCGTTALATYLSQHPQVFFSTPKELNYFNQDTPASYRRRAQGGKLIESDDQYLEFFRGARADHRIVAEGSVWYLSSRVALESIARFRPEARVVVMLRNPVDMAFSLHAEEVASFNEDISDFPTAWGLQEARARGRSVPRLCLAPSHLQYRDACSLGTQLERAFATFGRSQCKAILFDDFAAEPATAWAGLPEFLGLEPDGRTDFPRINERRAHRIALLSLALLVRPPFWLLRTAASLKRVIGLESLGIRPFVAKHNVAPPSPVWLDLEFRSRLVSEFLPQIAMLETTLGRDLSHWRRVEGS